jgi:pimeloyl-ACP methyl ester carboxylesterase
MPTIPINDTELYYLQDGAGEDVVLLHGLASNLAFWYSGVMVPLRQKYRVLAYDLRGHGKSAMPENGYTHYAMAEDLAGLVDAMNLHNFHLIGHSYGGLVAITYAQAHPHRLRSLTLADVPVDDARTKYQAEKYPELDLLEQLARNPVKSESRHTPFLPFHQGKGSGRTAKLWLKLLETTNAREDFHTRRISLRELQDLKVPTLLTYGFDSGWKDSGELLKKHLPDTNFMLIHNAGHAHPWEKPGLFLQSWLEFVQPLGQRPTPDRRQHLRNSIDLFLELRTEDNRSCLVKTLDISSTGILVESPEGVTPGSSVRLILNSTCSQPAISGRIIRQSDSTGRFQLAIHFDDVHDDYQFLSSVQEWMNSRTPSISTATAGLTS